MHAQVKDPSLLRFLVDVRGADLDAKQLRDDLMTMLIAGHETTAAVLTWALFSLMTCPAIAQKARAEVDSVLGDRIPGAPPWLFLTPLSIYLLALYLPSCQRRGR